MVTDYADYSDIRDMWGLSVTKREDSIDNECINLTAFKASKVDVDKDPLDVIS